MEQYHGTIVSLTHAVAVYYPFKSFGHAVTGTEICGEESAWSFWQSNSSKVKHVKHQVYLQEGLNLSFHGLLQLSRQEWKTDMWNRFLKTCTSIDVKFLQRIDLGVTRGLYDRLAAPLYIFFLSDNKSLEFPLVRSLQVTRCLKCKKAGYVWSISQCLFCHLQGKKEVLETKNSTNLRALMKYSQ